MANGREKKSALNYYDNYLTNYSSIYTDKQLRVFLKPLHLPLPNLSTPLRAKISQTKEENDQQRGQATTDGLHSRAAAETKVGVPDQPVPDGAEAAESGAGAGSERIPDQDLVPEQKGQDQKGQRHQEQFGLAPDGAGTLQSRHRHVERREIRQRLSPREVNSNLLTKKNL